MSTLTVLIIANTPSPNTETLFKAASQGAHEAVSDSVKIISKTPLEASSEDVLACDGIVIGTTENFGYMAGLIKDFFERIYYDCLEETQGLPYALYVKAGQDGQGTLSAVQRITTGLKWKLIQEPVLLHGPYKEDFETQCKELGALMAAGIEAGIY